MDPNTPMVLAAATYRSRDDAETDFKEVWGAHHQGELDHTAVAVLSKDAHGQLQVNRHDTTAKHMAWGGALIGAALVVVCPPAGAVALAGVGAGAGGIVGHFWHTIPKEDVKKAGDLLQADQAGLLVVAVDRKGTEIKNLLSLATESYVIDTKAGDLDKAWDDALKQASTVQSA